MFSNRPYRLLAAIAKLTQEDVTDKPNVRPDGLVISCFSHHSDYNITQTINDSTRYTQWDSMIATVHLCLFLSLSSTVLPLATTLVNKVKIVKIDQFNGHYAVQMYHTYDNWYDLVSVYLTWSVNLGSQWVSVKNGVSSAFYSVQGH